MSVKIHLMNSELCQFQQQPRSSYKEGRAGEYVCACIDVCVEAVSACEPVSVCLCVPSPFQVAVCMHLPCPQRLFPSPAHFCLQPGILLPRGLQTMFLAVLPSGSQGCYLFTVPGPSLENHPEVGTVHRLKQCYRGPQRSSEAVQTSQSHL